MTILSPHTALVTGGAGFIGSHLVDSLMNQQWEVTVFDNLSSGNVENVQQWLKNKRFRFVKGDLKNLADIEKAGVDAQVVFHFAANPEVRVGETEPSVHFEDNLAATFNLLEVVRKSKTAKMLVLASTSTIYGEASVMPTPEDYGPLVPISLYGASKLGCEGLVSSYAYTFGVRTLILRLANVVGTRSRHGVIIDFIKKLHKNSRKLEILGDGMQKKSYLHIDDCIDAAMHLTNRFLKSDRRVDIYNIGAFDQVDVKQIAEIVVEEVKLSKVEFAFTGGVDGGRGWLGDVKFMHLSIDKLLQTGWKPRYNSEQAVRRITKDLLGEISQEEKL